jgi:integrase
MKIVEPIRDLDLLKDVLSYLQDKKRYRDYTLIKVGINVGLRISDLSRMKWEDILYLNGTVKSHYEVVEQKTSKIRKVKLNEEVKKALLAYKEVYKPTDGIYVFNTRKLPYGHLDRKSAYKVVSGIFKEFGITSIGTHSLRKTFGYHLHKKGVPLGTIMTLLNHSNERTTMRYLGVNQDSMDEATDGLGL